MAAVHRAVALTSLKAVFATLAGVTAAAAVPTLLRLKMSAVSSASKKKEFATSASVSRKNLAANPAASLVAGKAPVRIQPLKPSAVVASVTSAAVEVGVAAAIAVVARPETTVGPVAAATHVT